MAKQLTPNNQTSKHTSSGDALFPYGPSACKHAHECVASIFVLSRPLQNFAACRWRRENKVYLFLYRFSLVGEFAFANIYSNAQLKPSSFGKEHSEEDLAYAKSGFSSSHSIPIESFWCVSNENMKEHNEKCAHTHAADSVGCWTVSFMVKIKYVMAECQQVRNRLFHFVSTTK